MRNTVDSLWTLEGRTPVKATDLFAWGRWFETADRRVAETEVAPGVRVSTVFLGVDHNFFGGPPLLFETMVFSDYGGEEQRRWATYEEAEAGHAEAVATLRARIVAASP